MREAPGSSLSDSLALARTSACLMAAWLTRATLVRMTLDTTITTIFTGIGVLFGVWRLLEGVRRDLTNQISAVNTRIDNVLLADRHGR